MTGKQRIQCVLDGDWPDCRPVMLHNFLMAAKEAGMTQGQYRNDPQKIAEAHIRAVEKYRYDGILLDIDTVTLAGATGVPIDYPEDLPARTSGPLLDTLNELDSLQKTDLSSNHRVNNWLEACRIIKEFVGQEIYIRGNCDQAPFSLASMIRGSENWLMDLLVNPQRAHQLLGVVYRHHNTIY